MPNQATASGRILVVDDQPANLRVVSSLLSRHGYEVVTASDGAEALAMLPELRPDLVLLDMLMPNMDGFTLLGEIKQNPDLLRLPVLFLTVAQDRELLLRAFDAGAVDYVTKPFSMEEVLIRAHRLVQRSGVVSGGSEVLVVGDLVMNTRTHEVTRGGVEIELTATQYNLLKFLMANVRTVLSKERILQDVWGYDFGGRANIVELYISYLRKKIDADRDPMIHTIRGAGYVIRPA